MPEKKTIDFIVNTIQKVFIKKSEQHFNLNNKLTRLIECLYIFVMSLYTNAYPNYLQKAFRETSTNIYICIDCVILEKPQSGFCTLLNNS